MWEEFCTFVLKMSVLRRGEATKVERFDLVRNV